jgi:hypothetical protein
MLLSNLTEDQKMIHKLISDFSENEIKPVASENERNLASSDLWDILCQLNMEEAD